MENLKNILEIIYMSEGILIATVYIYVITTRYLTTKYEKKEEKLIPPIVGKNTRSNSLKLK